MTIIGIAALFFVIGVVLMAVSAWGGPSPWCNRIAWLLWAVAAILWYVAAYGTGSEGVFNSRVR